MAGYYIVLDFDGTVVKHCYPAVGAEIGAAPILHKLVKNGHKILLNTMRSRNSEGIDTLQPAIDWFASHGIPLLASTKIQLRKNGHHHPKYMAIFTLMTEHLGHH